MLKKRVPAVFLLKQICPMHRRLNEMDDKHYAQIIVDANKMLWMNIMICSTII